MRSGSRRQVDTFKQSIRVKPYRVGPVNNCGAACDFCDALTDVVRADRFKVLAANPDYAIDDDRRVGSKFLAMDDNNFFTEAGLLARKLKQAPQISYRDNLATEIGDATQPRRRAGQFGHIWITSDFPYVAQWQAKLLIADRENNKSCCRGRTGSGQRLFMICRRRRGLGVNGSIEFLNVLN